VEFAVSDSSSIRPVKGRVALSRRVVLAGALQSLALLAACSAAPPSPEPAPTASPAPLSRGPACALPPVVRPTTVPYPGYTQMEPSTGLHVTGEAQEIDPISYRLKVIGLVEQPLSLTYDDMRCLPKVQARVSLTCPGFFTDVADLAGATFADLLALAQPRSQASRIRLTSVEGYTMPFSLDDVLAQDNFLAYQWKDEPLPPSHGFPLRAVFPRQSGGNWVKWVTQIEVS